MTFLSSVDFVALTMGQTLESIYLMWKTTGDTVWRERGWRIFQALESEAKTPSGYASLFAVAKSHSLLRDEMPR